MTKPNELTPFTFKSTGITVKIRKVSPFLTYEVRKAFPPPSPPTQEVDYGDGDIRVEENPGHPDYAVSMSKYNEDLSLSVRRMMIKRGVVCDVDMEALNELREFWKDEFNAELSERDDKVAYISFIAASTLEDLEDLVEAISRRSAPTELEVSQSEDMFQR